MKKISRWYPKGWSYEELAERWGLPHEWKRADDDEKIAKRISEFMLESIGGDFSDDKKKKQNEKQIAKDLRKFLLKLAEKEDRVGYYAPLWRGLAAIEDDECLLKAASLLVRKMWS